MTKEMRTSLKTDGKKLNKLPKEEQKQPLTNQKLSNPAVEIKETGQPLNKETLKEDF